MRAEVCLESTNAVENTERGNHATEGSKNNKPGSQATFGVDVVICDDCLVRCGGRFVVMVIGGRFMFGDWRGVVGGLSMS